MKTLARDVLVLGRPLSHYLREEDCLFRFGWQGLIFLGIFYCQKRRFDFFRFFQVLPELVRGNHYLDVSKFFVALSNCFFDGGVLSRVDSDLFFFLPFFVMVLVLLLHKAASANWT